MARTKRNTNGRRRSDPKRNSWLNELGEAPPMRPDAVVVPGPAIVVDKVRPKKVRKLPTVRKLRELPPAEQAVVKRQVAEFARWLAWRKEGERVYP